MGADGVRTKDANRDGLPDLVTGWEQGGVTRIYLMQGNETGLPGWIQVDAGRAPDVEDALFVDLDRDGAMDVVSSTEGNSRKILVHWAPADPDDYSDPSLWQTETLFEDGSRWMFALAMDIDGQHGPDLVIGGKDEGGKIGWLESPANPRIVADWKFHPWAAAAWTMSILARDMDGDGDLDILNSDRKGDRAGIRWFENPGKNMDLLTEPWVEHWVAEGLKDPMFIDTWDFDGDGLEEVVVPNYVNNNEGGLTIYQTRDWISWTPIPLTYPAKLGRAKAVAIGDINLDGRMDMVLSTENAEDRSGIVWLEYQDSWDNPDWKVHDVSGPEGNKFDLNLLLDLDGDGDLDIINTEENNNAASGNPGLGLIWYENPHIKK